MATHCQASPIKRERRTKAEIRAIKEGLCAIVEADHPMTVRQVFYQAEVAGLVEKTEADYNNTVARLLLEMRRQGKLPYAWIADNTRLMRKPSTYSSLSAFIERHQQAYRRDLWDEATDYVEIWCEKDALSAVLYQVTREFDVPLMVSRGFASESYLHAAADNIIDELIGGKQRAFVYLFTDYDPSGLKIANAIERGLQRLCHQIARDFTPDLLVVERVAVTDWQIEDLGLPSRPTKVNGNRHAADWPDGRPSVELDAIPPRMLRGLVEMCIERHVDQEHLERLRQIEAEERQQLALFGQGAA